MTGYPYHSPPPPPPSPPKCNHTISPPPPPPKCTPCPCVCVCQPPTQPPIAPTPYWLPPPQPPPPITPGPQPPPGPPDHTVIIAVFVSLGGVFFLAFLAVGLFCLAKKKPIPPPSPDKSVHLAPNIGCIDEHKTIRQIINPGPCGEKDVTVTIDDTVRIHEAAEVCAAVEPPDCDDRPSTFHAQGHLKCG